MALITSFESLSGSPLVPDDTPYTWTASEFEGLSLSGSASNVTEGSQSYRWSGTATAGGILVNASTGFEEVDLTGATQVSIDVTIVDIDASSYVQLQLEGGKGSFGTDETLAGETGSFTLTVDITGFSQISALTLLFRIRDGVSSSSYDIYWDNLRDDTVGVSGVGKLYLGSTEINKIYVGNTEVRKAYLGNVLVYDKTGI